MLISNAFKATSFSFAVTAVLLFEGCGASSETETYSNLCFYNYVTTRSSWPEFDADLYQTADSSGQRLDIYISLKKSRLKYRKVGSSFQATYVTNIRLSRDDEPPQANETQRVIRQSVYPTNSDSSYDAFLLSFRVMPGDYSVEVSITDGESGQKATRTYMKTIPAISDKVISLSDILLLARYDTVGQGRKITPFILSNVGLLSDTLKFLTVLVSHRPSSDSVFFRVYKLNNHYRLPSGFGGAPFSFRWSNQDPCRVDVDTVLAYSYSLHVAVDSGFSYIFGGVPKPFPGNYLLEVSVQDEEGSRAYSVLPFRIRERYFPDVTEDLMQMVNSLSYIASRGELERITKVRGDSAVRANLLKFWVDYGGYSKMAQYYQRVSQANRFFSTCLDGWWTPMGMLYVICGPPDYVECQGLRAERWTYIGAATNDRFVVDFRLTRETTNPEDRYYVVENIYSNLDFWSHYVNRWRTPY